MAQTFVSKANTDIVTAGNTVYTVATATTATVIGLSLCNKSGNTQIANVWFTRSAVNYYMAANVTIFPGSTFIPIGADQKVVLTAADAIKVSASNTGVVDVIMSALEIT
jgi:hypothetical protein